MKIHEGWTFKQALFFLVVYVLVVGPWIYMMITGGKK